MFSDSIKAKGRVHIEARDAAGNLVEQRDVDNLVVTSGLTYLAARAVGTPTAMTHMAIGTGSTAAALANTTLGTEVARAALTSSTSSGAVVTYVASWGPGVGTGAIAEIGLFNAASAGTMLARTVFLAVNKDASMTITATWTITLS